MTDRARVTSVRTETRFYVWLPVRLMTMDSRFVEAVTVIVDNPHLPWMYELYLSDDTSFTVQSVVGMERFVPGLYPMVVDAMSEERIRDRPSALAAPASRSPGESGQALASVPDPPLDGLPPADPGAGR